MWPRSLIPCAVTMAGALASVVGVALLSTSAAPGVALLACGLGCDVLDGYLARRLDAVSELGARLDYAVDVLVVGALAMLLSPWLLVPLVGVIAGSLVSGVRVSGRAAASVLVAASVLLGA
jgi:CDP-diacylglycerol--glycerol-3-phosphate 3-phosphatidyltransferase